MFPPLPFKGRPTDWVVVRTAETRSVGSQQAGGGGIIEGGEIVGSTVDWRDTAASTGTLGHCPG